MSEEERGGVWTNAPYCMKHRAFHFCDDRYPEYGTPRLYLAGTTVPIEEVIKIVRELAEYGPYPDFEDADGSCYFCGGKDYHGKDCTWNKANEINNLAGSLRLERRLSDPESEVLPLNDEPVSTTQKPPHDKTENHNTARKPKMSKSLHNH